MLQDYPRTFVSKKMDANQIATKGDINIILDRLDSLAKAIELRPDEQIPQLLNQKEAASFLCISPNTFRKRVLAGQIPRIEICNGIYRYAYADLKRIINL